MRVDTSQRAAETDRSQAAEGTVVDVDRLQALFPSHVAGLRRTDASGAWTGDLGITYVQATAEYQSEGARLTLTLVDMGSLADGSMGYAWLDAEFDRESSSGYERTTTFLGYPAYQAFHVDGQRFDMQVVVGKRFVVKAEGRGLEMEAVEEVLRGVRLPHLERMIERGV